MTITMLDEKIKLLLKEFPHTYSEELRINLDSLNEREIFKWFLASILYGRRISENIATKTYFTFQEKNLVSPESIIKAGWDKLVQALDEGGYVRYDFSTATRILSITQELVSRNLSLKEVLEKTRDYHELNSLLQSFKGVGPVTVTIFLRELRHLFKAANPPLSRHVIQASENLGISLEKHDRGTKQFVRIEAALLRLGKNFCGKKRCRACALQRICLKKSLGEN